METEIWKVVERCPKAEVSNMGQIRIIKTGRICRFSTKKNVKLVGVRYNGKRVNLNVANEVWRAFGSGKAYLHMHVLHRDGDNYNCCINNLYVVMDGNTKVQEWQAELYCKNARRIVLFELKKRGFTNGWYGYDIDNIIGEALYMGWKYLPSLKAQTFTALYYLMRKCVTWAITIEFRNGKQIREAEWAIYHMPKKTQEL